MCSGSMGSCLLVAATWFASCAAAVAQDPEATQPGFQDCSAAEYRRFDFRIGEFEVTGMGGGRAGDSGVVPALGGCMLVEFWRGAISGYGQANYYYDRNDQRWHTTFVNDNGEVIVMSGTFVREALVFTGQAAFDQFHGLHRMAWSPLPAGGVRQFWGYSTDNGASWKTIHVGTYVRRR